MFVKKKWKIDSRSVNKCINWSPLKSYGEAEQEHSQNPLIKQI